MASKMGGLPFVRLATILARRVSLVTQIGLMWSWQGGRRLESRRDGSAARRNRDRPPARAGLRHARRPLAPPRVHRSLPLRLPPDPDRGDRRRRWRPLPSPGAAAQGLDGHDDRRARRALPDRRARPGRAGQPHPHPHGLGADRGARLADLRQALLLDRAGPPRPRPGAAQRRFGLAGAGLARGAEAASGRPRVGCLGRQSDRRRRRQSLRDRHPVEAPNRLSPPMVLNRRLVLPLLAALALAALVVGVSACGYSSDEKHVTEGEPVELGELSFNVTFSRYLNP